MVKLWDYKYPDCLSWIVLVEQMLVGGMMLNALAERTVTNTESNREQPKAFEAVR